jgi:Ca2+-binding RTX toxin-like protein
VTVTFNDRADDGPAGEGDDARSDLEGLAGGLADETAVGSAAPERLEGGDGEDYLDGAGGVDDLSGGAGGDVLRARDGGPDRVGCGPGRDLAIVDRVDRVESDCELASFGGERPRRARRMVVWPLRGAVRLRAPGMARTVPLLDRLALPPSARFDASAGALALLTGRRAGVQTTRLAGGAFSLALQRVSLVPALRLARPDRRACTASPGAVLGRLSGSSMRNVVVRGAAGAARVAHGAWLVEERCAGTRYAARSGRMVVRDRGGRRVVVEDGEARLVRRAR